jgi:hypothetical protein
MPMRHLLYEDQKSKRAPKELAFFCGIQPAWLKKGPINVTLIEFSPLKNSEISLQVIRFIGLFINL